MVDPSSHVNVSLFERRHDEDNAFVVDEDVDVVGKMMMLN